MAGGPGEVKVQSMLPSAHRRRLALTATLLAGALLPAGAGAAPPPRADLSAAASRPPATARTGDTVRVTVTLRNRGAARAPATRTRISLGGTSRFSPADLVLASVRQAALKPHGRRQRTVRLRIPLDGRAGGRRTLLVCADAAGQVRERSERDNCTAAGAITLPAVRTEDLLSADLAAHRIGAEEAAALRIVALAGQPEALPARYRGAASTGSDATAAVARAAASMGSLPARARRLLQPLFVPPGATRAGAGARPRAAAQPQPGGEACTGGVGWRVPDVRRGWESLKAPRSGVSFWWQAGASADAAQAKVLARAMDDVIFPKLTQLMGRAPQGDGTLSCPHGSTGGLDVYLVGELGGRPWNAPTDPGPRAVTTPYTCATGRRNASFVRLADASPATLAHEFFHTLQFAFEDRTSCGRPAWLDEGTAEWAVEYAYPGTLKDTSAVWLERFENTDLFHRSYDAWPFWYSIARQAKPEAVRALYSALAADDPVPATDTAIGTFRARWPVFARDAYNQDPVFTFTTWTQTSLTPGPTQTLLGLDGQTAKSVPYTGSSLLFAATRDYEHFAIDPAVRRITLSGLPTSPDYALTALLHMKDGSWQERTATKGLVLCRDKPAEDVQDFVLVASNAAVAGKLEAQPRLALEDSCGLPHFRVVAADFSVHTDGSMSDPAAQACTSAVKGVEEYGGHLDREVSDPSYALKRGADGRLTGELFFDLPADGTTALDGCTDPYGDEQPCSTGRSIRPADGLDTIGFQIEVDPKRPDEARLRWRIHEASIGYFDADDSVCNVNEFYDFAGSEQQVTVVPMDQLLRGRHVLSNHGTFHWDVDERSGKPADLNLGWGYDITVQVVDADGRPVS